jgi:hypothetical protein
MYAQFSYLLPGLIVDEEKKRVFVDTSKGKDTDIESFINQIFSENLDFFTYDKEYFHGLHEFLGMDLDLKDILMMKGQITGPISLGFQVTDENKKPIYYNDIYRDMAVKNLKMMAEWQDRALKKICESTMIFLDEPYLSMIGSAFVSIDRNQAVEQMNEVLSGIEGIKAIHCCGNTDWGLVLETDIQVLNFDAYEYAESILLYPDKVIEFVENGGILAWGIVPTNEEALGRENVDTLSSKLEKDMKTLAEKGISLDDILRSSIFTPSCGLGPSTVECAERAFPLLRELSLKIKEKHGF